MFDIETVISSEIVQANPSLGDTAFASAAGVDFADEHGLATR